MKILERHPAVAVVAGTIDNMNSYQDEEKKYRRFFFIKWGDFKYPVNGWNEVARLVKGDKYANKERVKVLCKIKNYLVTPRSGKVYRAKYFELLQIKRTKEPDGAIAIIQGSVDNIIREAYTTRLTLRWTEDFDKQQDHETPIFHRGRWDVSEMEQVDITGDIKIHGEELYVEI